MKNFARWLFMKYWRKELLDLNKDFNNVYLIGSFASGIYHTFCKLKLTKVIKETNHAD